MPPLAKAQRTRPASLTAMISTPATIIISRLGGVSPLRCRKSFWDCNSHRDFLGLPPNRTHFLQTLPCKPQFFMIFRPALKRGGDLLRSFSGSPTPCAPTDPVHQGHPTPPAR